jgi:hypothetical protein
LFKAGHREEFVDRSTQWEQDWVESGLVYFKRVADHARVQRQGMLASEDGTNAYDLLNNWLVNPINLDTFLAEFLEITKQPVFIPVGMQLNALQIPNFLEIQTRIKVVRVIMVLKLFTGEYDQALALGEAALHLSNLILDHGSLI